MVLNAVTNFNMTKTKENEIQDSLHLAITAKHCGNQANVLNDNEKRTSYPYARLL